MIGVNVSKDPIPYMSEYQYYEFQAIDRPLDGAAQGRCGRFRHGRGSPRGASSTITNGATSRAIRASLWSNGSTFISISRIGARGV